MRTLLLAKNGENHVGRHSESGIWTALLAACVLLAVGGCSGSSAREEIEDEVQNVTGGVPPATGSGSTPSPGGTSNPGSPAPTVTLNSSNLTIDEGGNATLTWSSLDADSCSASGGWSGSRSLSGSQAVGPLSAATTFTLSCDGPGGTSIQMISVSVVGPVQLSWVAPEENVDGSPLIDLAGYRIYYGAASRSYSDMIELGSPGSTSHSLSLASGDYYVAMTALDADGNESAYSNEVIKTRL